VVTLIGCHDVTAPVPIRMGTRFLLVAVGGHGLPIDLATGPGAGIAIGDTFVFLTGGQKGWSDHHETFQQPGRLVRAVPPGDGRLAGDTLTITYGGSIYRERTYQRLH